MVNVAFEDIRVGWKVFLGAEEVGRVVDVAEQDFGVQRGTLLKQVIRLPKEEVAEAADGVVDLRLDGAARARLDGG